MMEYCTHCGTKLDPDAKFCTNCGADVTGESAVNPQLNVSNLPDKLGREIYKLGSSAGDFWTFKRMITPVIIQAIFWIGVAACVIGGIVFIGVGADEVGGLIPIGIALILVGPVAVRLWCELSILFFRMNETLTDIKNEISKRSD